MRTTSSRRWLPDLALHTLRRHRGAILGWVAAGGGVMWIFGAAYQSQVQGFTGGAKAFGVTVGAAAESMKALTGPFDRLDTYGGYVTYHNLGYATLLIGFWALVQGSKAIRGAEEKGELPGWLATGRTRAAIVAERALGFILALAAIVLGIGLLTWLGTLAAQQPSFLPSFGAIAEVALAGSVFFALALLLSQLVASSRTSSGITGAVMLAAFLVGNLNQEMGWWAWLKYLSPFWYAQQSRVLVPGHGVSLVATAVLAAAFAGLTAGGSWVFTRRDVGAPLWARRHHAGGEARQFRLRRPWLGTHWMAALHAQRMALAFWFAGTALWFTMYAGVAPTIITYWKGSELIRRLFAHMPAASLEAQYMSYVVDLTAPLLAAFALVQAAGWVREGEDGRTEVELSCPVSRRRLWLERMMALLVGAMVVVAGAVLGLLAGAGLGGLALDTSGVVRAAADLLLLALATGAVGALIVATLRSSTAIGVLGAFIGLSFFITVFGPMLYWPDWITRLSIFQAFGSPYLGAVAARDALFVTAVAVLGAGLTVMIATRRSAAP